ncbi:MAG: AraC family transcriptional regulator [Alphaproteobacteria bacterium]|nr:AraC family transcriptional regulator [Alphaproteobacteria bacterium]MBV8406637.1 AraC family transcriptional regulator [Alphaproteobacteria bacterium]
MVTLDLVLRIGTAAIFLVTGVILVRDRWRARSGPIAGLLALSIAADTALSATAGGPSPWLWPLRIIASGTSALLWIWTGAVFVDQFRPSWRDGLAWCVLPVIVLFGGYVLGAWTELTARGVALLFIGLALWRVLAELRDDLVERRRRLRVVLMLLGLLYAGGTVLAGAVDRGHAANARTHTLEAAALAVLAVAFALLTQRAIPLLGDPETAETGKSVAGASADGAPAPEDQDELLLGQLRRLMGTDRIYRGEGFGLASLAAAMQMPEYRLRQLINQRLGHRNFTSFVNEYRLADAQAALADPGQAAVPILTIALDAGFQSIGPFNRAFKAHTGMTPTAYRRQAKTSN